MKFGDFFLGGWPVFPPYLRLSITTYFGCSPRHILRAVVHALFLATVPAGFSVPYAFFSSYLFTTITSYEQTFPRRQFVIISPYMSGKCLFGHDLPDNCFVPSLIFLIFRTNVRHSSGEAAQYRAQEVGQYPT